MRLITVAASVLLLAACSKAPEGTFVQEGTSVVVTPASGPQRRVRLEARTDRIVRVTAVNDGNLVVPKSLMVVDAAGDKPAVTVTKKNDAVELDTGKVVARVSLANGAVSFTDKSGKAYLAEEPVTAWPAKGASLRFNAGTDEGLFGSGQHQNAQLDLNGEDVELAQHNMDIAVPFVVSTRNYGVLWDNNGITRLGNPRPYG
ncbi:MAG TPA: hypothetical protein VMF52_17205, partial [Steroidobacteraceae bacterium]|nr:hypothetical protein [Steroidobacteraceae bacterium]